MLKTLSIGNAFFDLFIPLDDNLINGDNISIPLGIKHNLHDIVRSSGGGAVNTSISLSYLGNEAYFGGILNADSWGQYIQQCLKDANVKLDGATFLENETSSFSLVFTSCGERSILINPGTNVHLHAPLLDTELISKMDWVYLSHLSTDDNDVTSVLEALTDCSIPKLTWNPGGSQLKKGMDDLVNKAILKKTTVILLNTTELKLFTGVSDVRDGITLLHNHGVDYCVISDGGNGAHGSDGSTLWYCPALSILDSSLKCIDTTGAGDALGSAATSALANGKTLPEALKNGTINAASVVSHLGAQAGLLTQTLLNEWQQRYPLLVTDSPL